MRIGVVGAGGVGGLVAGLLSRAGHEVALVARGAALDAIQARGLRVDSPLGVFDARVETAASTGELSPVDVALVAVKTWQVPVAAAPLASWLRPGGFVVPLQNGVDAPDQCVAAVGPERVVGGLCRLIGWIAEPGAVKHVGNPPTMTIGAWRAPIAGRTEPLVAALEASGMNVQIAHDFPAALWEKLLFIASFGGVGAVTRSTAGVLRRLPETRRLLTDAFEEVRAVAVAKGIAVAPDVVAKTLAFVDTLPEDATSSLQRDIVAGRPSELEALSGAVSRIACELGVDVPVHETIYAALLPTQLQSMAGTT